MKAEDTVVKASEVMEIIESNSGSLPTTKAILDYLSPKLDAIVNTERKVGIKEVVELIGEEPFEHNYSMYGHEVDDCFACKYEAKLKEWGIK